ncbi:MAG TPA: GGDEF domain-containing protein [Mycobacteriales bacterium]|nr:GGDEF domain-containing protein [Mycobacteriales bacterium]
MSAGRAHGVVEIQLGRGVLHAGIRDALETLAVHAATTLAAARLYAKIEEQSRSDALTGLANRRRLDEDLLSEGALASRGHRSLALLIIDIDRFKTYNDAFGHPAGDALLTSVAELLTESLRPSDTAYRYGGEEFVVLARDTGLTAASALAERLRTTIAGRLRSQRITISIGAAAVPENTATVVDLVEQADSALYAAKRAGRNRVVAATPTPTPPVQELGRIRRFGGTAS